MLSCARVRVYGNQSGRLKRQYRRKMEGRKDNERAEVKRGIELVRESGQLLNLGAATSSTRTSRGLVLFQLPLIELVW